MSFNYGREEKKWRLWKEAEEKQLRSLGVNEDTIEQLHTHDWAVFNSDRRFYRLFHVLIKVDRLTLQIIVMQLQGYSTHDIAASLRLTEEAVYKRVRRLKEKIKKVLK